MADEWDQYEVKSSSGQGDDWEQYAVSATQQPSQVPQAMSEQPQDAQSGFMKFISQINPAFKLALTHPETFVGGQVSPEELNRVTNMDYSDIYRTAGATPTKEGILPFAQSKNMAGQLVPQVAGAMIDLPQMAGLAVGGYASGKVSQLAGRLAKTSPAFRRFLQLRTPTLSKQFLQDNPMAPVYKEINGIPRDITKPLPKKSEKLVQHGQKLVDAVHETMDNLGNQYGETLKPFYKNKVTDFGGISDDQLKSVGIDPAKATIKDLWETRWDLLKQVGNPWKKEELLKKTSLKEDELVNLLTRLKATTLNNIDQKARNEIIKLDPQFEDAVKAGKGILRSIYDPDTGKVNTVRLVNIFKQKNDQGTRDLFQRFGEYDKRVNDVASAVKSYNRSELAKKVAVVGVGGVGVEQFLRWRERQLLQRIPGMQGQQ